MDKDRESLLFELAESRRQNELLMAKIASMKGSELAACELMVARERIEELEKQLSGKESECSARLQQRESEFRRVRETLEGLLREEQEARAEDARRHSEELQQLRRSPTTSPTCLPVLPPAPVPIKLATSQRLYKSEYHDPNPQMVAPASPDKRQLRDAAAAEDAQQASVSSSERRKEAKSHFRLRRSSRVQTLREKGSPQDAELKMPTASVDDSAIPTQPPASPTLTVTTSPGPVTRNRSLTQAAVPPQTACGSLSPLPSPPPLSPRQLSSGSVVATVQVPGSPAPLPPADAMMKRSSSFKEDMDGLSTIQKGQIDVVAAVMRMVADLSRSIRSVKELDDPNLRGFIDAAVCLCKVLQNRPLPPQETAYTEPAVKHDNPKFVQLVIRLDRCLWEANAKLQAIHSFLVAAVARRSEEIAASKILAQLLVSVREIPFFAAV